MDMQSRKYGRTFHYPFSPGTTSDDRINHHWWQDVQKIKQLVHTEKLDGENNCLNQFGVFARSHAAPTQSAWTQQIRQRWQLIKDDLGNIEIFGENLYAIHSIEYRHLEEYFFVFAARIKDSWLSWEEVKFYAALFDFPTVPEIILPETQCEPAFMQNIIETAKQDSRLSSWDTKTQQRCSMEGIVSRDAGEYLVTDFSHHVFKYVRKNHVKTDIHWKRHWQRASLHFEYLSNANKYRVKGERG
ncbi:RNA ligase family protein [Xenorhabdus hominickii]|uniref:2'-5' RNA ligase n=1 Tax=Xenorhabdus hominickii TaxID=351679 RepID=A0A2G0Q4K8_XENHO|nr:RNA ligase family protein [Xenorhabdus hominickii]AOM42439.1 2'-5' RNA ligase [Xenorhabdus hominickii]PHM54156.1 2'-5' RNA ligase [Xenorhabdus hominickii]